VPAGVTGVSAGSHICADLARASHISGPGWYVPWLSSTSIDVATPLLFQDFPLPWSRPDGLLVAASTVQLLAGETLRPVNVTETGDYLGDVEVWTGSDASGHATTSTCNDWTDATGAYEGTVGVAARRDAGWTDSTTKGCDGLRRLYCVGEPFID
jgi:hypothetical protein